MPPFLARRLLVRALLPGAGMLVLLPLNWLRLPWLGLAVYLPYCVLIGWLAIRFNRRFVQRLEAAGYLVCWQCGYDLSGAGGPGRCPECGREFQPEPLRALWKRNSWTARNALKPPA